MDTGLPSNYNDENMLIGANRLNIKIKDYLNYINYELLVSQSISNEFYNDIQDSLTEYLEEINEYLRDISAYDFAPRNDRLTKEGVLADLYTNLDEIKKMLRYIINSIDNGTLIIDDTIGGKRKNKKTIKNKKSRKTKKSKRANKKAKSKRR